jgi:hypothetical protein
MLTKDILFGMNVLTLVGLIMTGFGLTLHRSANARVPLCIAVMGRRDGACAGRAICERLVALSG